MNHLKITGHLEENGEAIVATEINQTGSIRSGEKILVSIDAD